MRSEELVADVVVVGSGSAGAALAAQVLSRSNATVALLESGPDYGRFEDGAWPADLLDPKEFVTSHDWGYGDGHRNAKFERARVIGGCSSHNGCTATWGIAADYDAWAASAPGWSGAELGPYFATASEMLRLTAYSIEECDPLHRLFLQACKASGLSWVPDFNDLSVTTGYGTCPANIHDGVRWNAAFGFIDPLRDDPRLQIVDRCDVTELVLEGARAVGVRARREGAEIVVRGDHVVLSAGVYGSPAILLRSGIGGAQEVARIGVEPRCDLPAVGRGLQDHASVSLPLTLSDGLSRDLRDFYATSWVPGELAAARIRSSHSAENAFDIQVAVLPGPEPAAGDPWAAELEVMAMRVMSTGSLALDSCDPSHRGPIDHAYLTDPHDRAVLVEGITWARALLDQPAMAGLAAEDSGSRGKSALEKVRAIPDGMHCYHPVGTCRMGEDAATTVVSPRGAVHGFEGLYVADASIMPTVPRAHTNVPSVVVGLRIADLLSEVLR